MAQRVAFALPTAVRASLTHATVQLPRQTPLSVTSLPVYRLHAAPFHSHRPLMTATTPSPPPSPPPVSTPPSPPTYKIALLYDADCPLCMREVNFLSRRVEVQGSPPSIKFVDITSPDYSAADNAGIDYETAMGRIHGIKPDGTVLVGVPVFRAAYEAAGLGWVYAVTTLPGVGVAADMVYNLWADFRLKLTGRPPLEDIMRLRRDEGEKTCR